MSKAQTLKDIAQAAGVSVASVSRVVTGKSVREATRKKVLEQIARSGYTPNLAARSLRTNSNRMIACTVRGLMNPAFLPVIQSIEMAARARGYRLLLTTVDDDPQAQQQTLGQLRAQGVDGLIFAGSAENSTQLIASLGFPVVVLDRERQPDVDAVNVAHGAGIREAVAYLASLGHKQIGLCAPMQDILPGRERVQALYSACQELGLPDPTPYVRTGCSDAKTSFSGASELINLPDRPTAVIAGGMAVLAGTLRAIKVAGLKVGQDISLISGMDSELAELAAPAITAIRWNLFDWGSIAAQMLFERIEGDGLMSGRYVCLPVELVTRQSCGPR